MGKNVIQRYTALGLIFLILLILKGQAGAISIPEEQKLSRKFMERIKQQHVILHDPLADHFLQNMGRHLLETLPAQPFSYSFYLVNDDNFNAFAGPGAHIFIHKGLITALSTADELAGIMAHEISHVVSRHISQSIDRSKIVNLGSFAGVLAGAIVGASGGSGEAVQALTISSLAAGQSAMLAYTRANETEADQKALILLKKSCYDPQGLLQGLMTIRESDFQGVESIPDYFKTHPGTSKRIANISGILSDYNKKDAKTPPCPDIHDFTILKYRLMGLYGNIKETASLLETQLAANKNDPAVNYGMGLIFSRQNRRKQAIACLQKAHELGKKDPGILLELGRAYMLDGKFTRGISLLEPLLSHPVIGIQARYYIAVAQLESGRTKAAEKNLSRVLGLSPNNFPRAYYHMASAMAQQQRPFLSHYYLGVYYCKTGSKKNARIHLKKALSGGLAQPYSTDAKHRLKELTSSS